MQRRSLPIGTALVGIVATAAAVAVLIWVRNESLEVADVRAAPVWVRVSPPPRVLERALSFELRRGPTAAVRAGALSGTVTGVGVRVGDRLEPTGVPPITVDGLPRPWFVASAPLYRSLSLGDQGLDVDELSVWLAAQGFTTGHTDGAALSRTYLAAVRAWADKHDFGARVAAFEPVWVTWLPPELVGARAGTVDVVVGGLMPGQGQALVTIARAIESAVPAAEGSGPAVDALAGVSTTIRVGSAEFPYGGGPLASDAIEILNDTVSSETTSVVLIARDRFPAGAVAVPSSALLVTGSGDGCVVEAAGGEGEGAAPAPVTVIGGRNGAAFVVGVKGFVLANPDDLATAGCR